MRMQTTAGKGLAFQVQSECLGLKPFRWLKSDIIQEEEVRDKT